MQKAFVVPLAALVLGGATLFGVHRAYAQQEAVIEKSDVVAFTHSGAGMKLQIGPNELAKKIAERFGLQESEVQQVFDEHQAEIEARIEQEYQDRLNEAVANGELTEEQRQLVLDKRAELEAEMLTPEEMEGMTEEQRREAMKNHHEGLKAWAAENGIDMKYFGMVKVVHKAR